jgi:hypothetical protein
VAENKAAVVVCCAVVWYRGVVCVGVVFVERASPHQGFKYDMGQNRLPPISPKTDKTNQKLI